jgi:anti-sigma regulatory factor (Ser/Thr protein kinase)
VSERSGSPVGAVDEDVASLSPGLPLRSVSHLELLLEADPGVLASLRHQSVDWLRQLRWPAAPIVDAVIALDAAVSNSVRHAYRGPRGHVSVHALAARQRGGKGAARFTVRDWGKWRIGDPSQPGYGMALMDRLSADLYIETGHDGTVVILTTPIVALL